MKIHMRQVFAVLRFVIIVILVVVADRMYTRYGTVVMDQYDDTMKPAVRPLQRLWYDKLQRDADVFRRKDLVVFRPPSKPSVWRAGRVVETEGGTYRDVIVPREYLYVRSDNPGGNQAFRFSGLVHQHFVLGKVIWEKIVPRNE